MRHNPNVQYILNYRAGPFPLSYTAANLGACFAIRHATPAGVTTRLGRRWFRAWRNESVAGGTMLPVTSDGTPPGGEDHISDNAWHDITLNARMTDTVTRPSVTFLWD